MAKWTELQDPKILERTDLSEEVYTGWSVEDLVKDHFDPKGLIKLSPQTLNQRVDGGAKPGHHLLIFAPTEMGKTLFGINMVAGFLKQNLRVLYVGNEDPIADIDMRLVNRLTGMIKQDIYKDLDKAKDLLKRSNYENFTIAGLAPGTFTKIRDLIYEIDPHVLVLDQLGNLDVRIDNSPTQSFLKASKEARALGKSQGLLVISVAQAADNAYGKLHLKRNDIQWSNVDVPAQTDLMIGIGADEEMESRGYRRISLPKNKLSGDHGYFDVRFVKELSKVEDIGI